MAMTQVANVGTVGIIVSVVIANGATQSEEIATGGMIVWGVLIPGAWTTANLTFENGIVTGTTKTVTDGVTASTNYTVQATQDQWSPVDPAKGIGAGGFCKIVSTASQGAARTLNVLLRYI